jgi:hypothetical protein
MECAAAEGIAELEGGEVGVPEADVPDEDLSLAEAGGTGSHAWPGLGFDGSNGGALRIFLGMALTGCELMTSVCLYSQFSDRPLLYPVSNDGNAGNSHTQLALGSKKRHHTPSSRMSFILRQRFRKTASIRLRSSMMP